MFSNWKENFQACFKALQEVTSEKEELEKQIIEANKIVTKLAKMRFTTDKIILISQLRNTLNGKTTTQQKEKE